MPTIRPVCSIGRRSGAWSEDIPLGLTRKTTITFGKRSERTPRTSGVSANFQGDREPEYRPKYPYWLVGKGGYTLQLELFKFRVWRIFREHTGHWPVVSMCFHFFSGVGMFAGLIFWYEATKRWHTHEVWATFFAGLVLWGFLSEVGTVAARKLDWKLFGRK